MDSKTPERQGREYEYQQLPKTAQTPELRKPPKPNTAKYSVLKRFGNYVVDAAERRKTQLKQKYQTRLQHIRARKERRRFIEDKKRQEQLRTKRIQEHRQYLEEVQQENVMRERIVK